MTTSLPFELSENAVTNWLQSLSQLNNVNAANTLHTVIKQLRSGKIPANALFDILNHFIPAVLYANTAVESSLRVKRDINNSAKLLKVEKLSIHLLHNLSVAFHLCSQSKSLSAEKKLLSIYYALQFIGLTLRQSSIFHQLPSSTLWRESVDLYQIANNANILEHEIKHKIKELKNQTSIKSVIKRNCLFSLLAPHTFSSAQIKALFLVINQHADVLNIDNKTSVNSIFSWDLTTSAPPYIEDQSQSMRALALEIDPSQFTSLLQSKNVSSPLDATTLNAVIVRLSGYKNLINSTLPSALVINHLIIGHEEITKHLQKLEKFNKIRKLGSQPNSHQYAGNTPFEAQEQQDPSGLSRQPDLPETAKSVKILQTTDTQTAIAETPALKCKLGELALICAKNDYELSIIRQIKITNQSNTTHILLEKIMGTPSFSQFSAPPLTTNKLITLINDNKTTETFTAPCKLSKGTQLSLVLDQTLLLGKLTDFTSAYMRYAIM